MTEYKMEDFNTEDKRYEDYRGFRLVFTDPYGHVHVERETGGRIPDALGGSWTNISLLQKKIDWYLGMKEEEENKPPQDKNTRKVQEILKAREAEDTVVTAPAVVTGNNSPTKDFMAQSTVEKKRYVEKTKKGN